MRGRDFEETLRLCEDVMKTFRGSEETLKDYGLQRIQYSALSEVYVETNGTWLKLTTIYYNG